MANVIPSTSLGTDAASDRSGLGRVAGLHPGTAAERRFRFELAAHPGSVARARHLTRTRLAGWAVCEDTCDTAVLVVSELVTNAIVHTAGEHVVCELHDEDGFIRIAVRDEGWAPGQSHPATQRPEEEHGRGLLLVAALCRAWGAQDAGPGLLVWAELAREAERSVRDEQPGPARPSRDRSCAAGRSRATEDTGAHSDLGWSVGKPPAEDQDSGAESSWGTGTEWA